MSEPIISAHSYKTSADIGPWTRRLILFLRAMAALSMLKGLLHWSVVIGIGDPTGTAFDQKEQAWQAATIFFAVLDLVAAVGLWLAATWGGVIWLTAMISMIVIELFFPQVFGGSTWIPALSFLLISAYVVLAMLAGRERGE